MYFLALCINRFSKFSGTIVKAVAYCIYFFLPKLRFTIPQYSPAKFKPSKNQTIPRIVWQTNYTNKVALPVYINYLFNRLLSLDYDYRYMSHESREDFIKQNATADVYEAFCSLTDGAAQADFWRVFTLNYTGGVYLDIDANFCLPLNKLIKPEFKELFLMTKHRYSNYFMASAPDNKYLNKTLELIVENIKNKNIGGGVYDLTGPTVLNKAIGGDEVNHRHNRYTCVQGSFTNEYFQYIDKPRGKWTHVDKESLIKDKD